MFVRNNIIYFILIFFIYRIILIYFGLIELNFSGWSELQLEALNKHFFETLWFFGTLPIGNLFILKFSSYFVDLFDLKYFFFTLNSLYSLISVLLISKIFIELKFKKSIILFFVIFISMMLISYESWQVSHHDHINTLIFSLITYYLFFLIKNNQQNILLLCTILLLLVLFSTLSIFVTIVLYMITFFYFKKIKVISNLIFILFFIFNVGIHYKNKLNFNLFSATTISNLNLIQKTVHAIGIHEFQKLVAKDGEINISIKECYRSIYEDNEWYPEGRDNIVGQHFIASCFFDHDKGIYDINKVQKISNYKDNYQLRKAIKDDELIYAKQKWLTQFGYPENNLKTAIYFQSFGPHIFLKALFEYPFEMIIGTIGAKGFVLTIGKSLSWASVFPLDYQLKNYNWTYFEKIMSQFLRIFNIIGLSLSIYYVPKVLINGLIRKKFSTIDIFYLSIICISSIFITLISLITCCENPRHMVMIFFMITTIAIINYAKIIRKID